jgi:PilZ domain
VDTRTYAGQQGLPVEAKDGEDGLSRRQRRKGKVAEGAAADAAVAAGRAPVDPTSFDWSRLRQSPRIRCSGSVELRTKGSDVCLWGTLTDISLHGCYVEIENTFPVDTGVYLVLKSFGIRIETPGIVRTSFPALGMGIAYAEMEAEQEMQLKELIDALTSGGIPKRIPAAASERKDVIDPIAFLDEMTKFFRKNLLLSREEFHKIAGRVRRS